MRLEGNNLGERQRYFNTQVDKAISKNIDFASIRNEPVDSDIEQLYKIDIASRFKDIDFLLETLKSGDSLHITRVLKKQWLFEDEYQLIMNPEYLNKNIFPQMSSKMVKKLLSTASMWITNEERAEKFYLHCKQNNMDNIAGKFLLATSESFKESVLENHFKVVKKMVYKNEETLKFLIGTSFKLADLYCRKKRGIRITEVLYQLRFLYSVDCDQYLGMLETYLVDDLNSEYDCKVYSDIYNPYRFRLRISRDIFKRHKERILEHPRVYTCILNKNCVASFINCEDAKYFLESLLPDNRDEFCRKFLIWFEYIINVIPLGERYEVLKEIYYKKYTDPIEMGNKLYPDSLLKHMDAAQKENWALERLACGQELHDRHCWYKFVNFELAFEEVKKMLLVTNDSNKRKELLSVLAESAKNQTDVEKLLNYFYARHINEDASHKCEFLETIQIHHNVFCFGKNCWTVYNKILYSLNIYTNIRNYDTLIFKTQAYLYHILHGIDLPEVLKCSFLLELESTLRVTSIICVCLKPDIVQFDEKGVLTVYKHMLNVFIEKLNNLDKNELNDKSIHKAIGIIDDIKALHIDFYGKEIIKDDLPDIVRKFMELQESGNDKKGLYKVPDEFMRNLKNRASLVLDFDLLERSINHTYINKQIFKVNLNKLIRKLKIYFHHDIAQLYLDYFKRACSKEQYRAVNVAVYGIFQLADEKFKREFISKHTPADTKIKHDEMDRNLLCIRGAICRYACLSRPHIEIDCILPYISGDYLQYCIPMFNVFMSQYPPAMQMKFVKSLLDRPVSVQKHGIRLAFRCFETEDLIDLLLDSWRKHQNFSLRMLIYRCVMKRVEKCDATQEKMIEVLNKITLDLKENECEDVMKFLKYTKYSNNLRKEPLMGTYLDALWTVISKFPDSERTVTLLKLPIIDLMATHIHTIPLETAKKIVTDYIHVVFIEENEIYRSSDGVYKVISLANRYICKFWNDEETLGLVMLVIQTEKRRKFSDHTNFLDVFLDTLINESYLMGCPLEINYYLETILEYLTKSVSNHEFFALNIYMKVVILTNRVFEKGRDIILKSNASDDEIVEEIAKEFVTELTSDDLLNINMFSTALHHVGNMIKLNVKRMAEHLIPGGSDQSKNNLKDKLLIFIALNLADSKDTQTVFLAIAIMPDELSDEIIEWDYYNIFFEKLSKNESQDIKCFLNIKEFQHSFL